MDSTDTVKRNIHDVDFTHTNKAKHPGNQKFYVLANRLLQDGQYNPNLAEPKKKKLVNGIRRCMASLDPPGRFLKNYTSNHGRSFRVLTKKEAQTKINEFLRKEWEKKKAAGMYCSAPHITSHGSAVVENFVLLGSLTS